MRSQLAPGGVRPVRTSAESRKERAAAAAAAEARAPKADYSKEFRKLAAPVQTAVNEKKWADVLAALPALEAVPAPTHDDLKAIATWRLQATQGVGDRGRIRGEPSRSSSLTGTRSPRTSAPCTGSSRRTTAAKKDSAKTLEHFQAFVDATPDVQGDELETLGRLHLQAGAQRGGLPVPRQGDRPGEGQEREA